MEEIKRNARFDPNWPRERLLKALKSPKLRAQATRKLQGRLTALYKRHVSQADALALLKFYDSHPKLAGASSELWRQETKLLATALSHHRTLLSREVDSPGWGSYADDCRRRNEGSAAGNLLAISNSQALVREGDLNKTGAQDFAQSLTKLAELGLIPAYVAEGGSMGYTFEMTRCPGGQGWFATASPKSLGESGRYHYGINSRGEFVYSEKEKCRFDPKDASVVSGEKLEDR